MRPFHRLLLRLSGIDPSATLNGLPFDRPSSIPDDAAALLGRLRDLVAGSILPSGRVDYRGLRESPAYAVYREESARLRTFDPRALRDRDERLAFWINLYNALVIDAVVRLRVRRVKNSPGFFWRAAYQVGGLRFAANDIEHGVLRADRATPPLPGAHFAFDDPRRGYAIRPLDPRIHFALVCASRSCPPIRAYTPDGIDDQLDLAAGVFLGGSSRLDRPNRRVRLSRIFLWYAHDFGGPVLGLGSRSGLRRTVADLARPGHPQLAEALEDPGFRLSFEPYDWSLNGIG